MDAAAVDRARRLSCQVPRGAERENIRESTPEGLDTASRKGGHGGRPPVVTDDMPHTVLRRRANGESAEQIRPDLIIPTGKRKGHNPSVAGIHRALAEYAKREASPEAAEKAPPTSPPSKPAKSPTPPATCHFAVASGEPGLYLCPDDCEPDRGQPCERLDLTVDLSGKRQGFGSHPTVRDPRPTPPR
ncbi:hypothetical protein [Embleya sp. NPDC059259]|uniref:hypothetical protein n=1 Tax=unclassified Embleya TaxID=2699296 RepID=UPI0036C5C2FE